MFLLFPATCVAAGQWGGGAVVSINSPVRMRIYIGKQPHHILVSESKVASTPPPLL